MAELLLHQRYRAQDGASVSEALQGVFGVGTAVTDSGGALRYDQVSLVDDGVSVSRITSAGAAVRVRTRAAPDLMALHVRSGGLVLEQDDDRVVLEEGALGLVLLGRPAELSWEEVAVDVFSFPHGTVRRLLGSGDRPLRLRAARIRATSAPMTSLWRRTAATLAGEVLQHEELFDSDLVREQAVGAVLGTTIEAFGISDIADDEDAVDDGTLRRAQVYLDAHLGDSISVVDIARACGVSVRGLQLAYRRGGEGTPVLHLRRTRMAAAREALTATGEDRPRTVAEVARALSYSNLGRFSAHYRETFGESPSTTLRADRVDDAR